MKHLCSCSRGIAVGGKGNYTFPAAGNQQAIIEEAVLEWVLEWFRLPVRLQS